MEELLNSLRKDARTIIDQSIKAVLPETAVIRALEKKKFEGRVVVIAIGKAAWTMAVAARKTLGEKICKGVVVTKYGHAQGPIEGFEIQEAGHPIPDANSERGAEMALTAVADLTESDHVVFLLSGGGSALFEKPMAGIDLTDITAMTDQLLACGADIVEINTVRKHMSAVKGGRFAEQCGKARIHAVVLSDVIGDRLDAIASGPTFADPSTSQEALAIIRKYGLRMSVELESVLSRETPKQVMQSESALIGSVGLLCEAAAAEAENLGYTTAILTASLACEAKEAGRFMAAMAREISQGKRSAFRKPCAIIAGGETVVRLIGKGKGGRNQELALSAAVEMEGLQHAVLFSVGSDGTDGVSDAAGGIADGQTAARIRASGKAPEDFLNDNDSYHALKAAGDLIVTGPTGTNVNDLIVLLCK